MGDLRAIYELAARQHGAFSRSQARAVGFDSSAVLRRLRSGQWAQIDDAVLAVASAPPTWEQTLAAALLSRQKAILTHRTALRLYGVGDFKRSRPVLLVPRTSNVRSAIADLYETDQFDRIASTTIEGFRVTTMPETLLLTARDVRGPLLQGLFDEALVSGRLDLGAMAATIDREAGRRTPGTPQLRRLTSSRRPTAPSRSSSYLERLMETLLADNRVPMWTREYPFSLGDVTARVDFWIPTARLVVEADGRSWHARWQDMGNDRKRDNALATQGIQVLRYLYDMLTEDPQRCLDEILTVCQVRAA